MKKIMLKWDCGRRIEPIPFLPSDFNESSPLVVEIKKNGIELNFT